MASDGEAHPPATLYDLDAIRLSTQNRLGLLKKEQEDVDLWAAGLRTSLPIADLRRVLAGMR